MAADAAASFSRDINSIYLQDEWQITDSVMLTGGLRYDQYDSSDTPTYNPVFEQRYGFDNTKSFDGLDLLQPRLGVSWELPTSRFGTTQLNAGYGVFGGGDPTVHFANAYQNFGGAIGSGNEGSAPCTDADLQVTAGGQFTGLPDCIRTAAAASANANTGSVAAVDPDFDLPSNQRWSIGMNHLMSSGIGFFDGWEIQADYIFTDPPFGGNIMYSELNFMYEAWLKVFTNNKQEAIINDAQKKGLSDYQRLMEQCFSEFYRILKPKRWMTVEFHNSLNSVWNSIQEVMMRAGFVVADVRTLDKQQGTFKQVTTTTAVKQDLIITAYKPSEYFIEFFHKNKGSKNVVWEFIRQHLAQLPIFSESKSALEILPERQNRLPN